MIWLPLARLIVLCSSAAALSQERYEYAKQSCTVFNASFSGLPAQGHALREKSMNAPVLEKFVASSSAQAAIDFTQEMVRIDSTNGKEEALARQLEAKLKSLEVGKVWCEKTYEGRFNTLWEVDSGKPGPHLLFTG